MNIGIIGYGRMGRMLTEKFAAAGKPEDGSIFVSSRTKEKLHSLQAGVNGCGNNSEAAAQADVVFLCVKPGDMKDILEENFTNKEYVVYGILAPFALILLMSFAGWVG